MNTVDNELMQLKNMYQSIRGTFSESQQRLVTKGSDWSSEDIEKAATQRCILNKALTYVRDKLKFPLPSENTIKRRLQQISVPPGFNNLSLDILKAHASLFR